MNSPGQGGSGSNQEYRGSPVRNIQRPPLPPTPPTPRPRASPSPTSSFQSVFSGSSSPGQGSPYKYKPTLPSPLPNESGYHVSRRVEGHKTNDAIHRTNYCQAFVPYSQGSNMNIKITNTEARVRINTAISEPKFSTPPSPGRTQETWVPIISSPGQGRTVQPTTFPTPPSPGQSGKTSPAPYTRVDSQDSPRWKRQASTTANVRNNSTSETGWFSFLKP